MSDITLPLDPGPAGWNEILPARQPCPALSESIHADYLIIGAGFAGQSAALRLTQLAPEAKIVLLEARQIASGPAGRNSGFMIDLPHTLSSSDYAGQQTTDQRQTAQNRAAIAFALDAQASLQLSPSCIRRVGKINAAATDKGLKHNQTYATHLDALQEPYELLSQSDMQTITGINYYQGGLWTPGTAMLQPASYMRELADALIKKQVQLYEQTPVTRLTKTHQQWQATTPQGKVSADKVILAVNGLLEDFGYYTNRFMPILTYASMTRRLTTEEANNLGGKPEWACTPSDPMGTTVRRIRDGDSYRLLVRNQVTYEPSQTCSDQKLQRIAKKHRAAFDARFPMLKQITMDYCWGGRLCLSLNHVSVIGELTDSLYAACCQNGLGTAKGTVAGIIAAEKAAQATTSLIPDYQDEPPPTQLLPKALMSLGVNRYLDFKQWQAGKEL